ncbi:hypothetical protein AVEN_161034-1 [Araneus ventricosus]|uniref:Uncharacterized protein n=1 Tax=Araneus ventricosus TaxID=182803 RepID=A0A4Y2VX11_ARAVE|nr:hypothetical protein AVEN_50986-1 [Araneus ventricosus]GBO29943.1 hypothetical protein AVEN_161034-1 [Araneus ventricosus]
MIVSISKALSLVQTACGLAKPRVARGSYLWTAVGGIRTVAPFLRHVALQISRQRSSERMQWYRLATPLSFDVRAIYRHIAGNNRCTYKSTSHIDSSCSDDRK